MAGDPAFRAGGFKGATAMDAIIEARRLVEDAFMPLLIALLYISAV